MDETLRQHRENPEVHHEERDVNIRAILWFIFFSVATAVVIHLIVWWMFQKFADMERRKTPPPLSYVEQGKKPIEPEPKLQINPIAELAAVRRADEIQRSSYGWVDRERGVVRIPIEEAMRIAVGRGFAVRQSPQAAVPAAVPAEPAREGVTTP